MKKKMEKTLTFYTASKSSAFDLFRMTNRKRLTFHSILYGTYIEPFYKHTYTQREGEHTFIRTNDDIVHIRNFARVRDTCLVQR